MLKEKLNVIDLAEWKAPGLKEDMPHGDMPGDKIVISEEHERKAQKIFPIMVKMLRELGGNKAIVSVFGGSGVGKSMIS